MAESPGVRRESAKETRIALYRQLVFEAAERAFAENGVEDPKREEIAAGSGRALGTRYSVFSGKARLVAAIHETRLGEILQLTTDAALGTTEPLDTLLRGIRVSIDPPPMARMRIAMQQVQLADWVEGGTQRDPETLVREMETQVRRSFCVQP